MTIIVWSWLITIWIMGTVCSAMAATSAYRELQDLKTGGYVEMRVKRRLKRKWIIYCSISIFIAATALVTFLQLLEISFGVH